MSSLLWSWLRTLPRAGASARHDRQVADELNWRRRDNNKGDAPTLPEGLELQWLGTAGFRLSYAGVTLLIDPYATRVPLAKVLGRAPVSPDAAMIDRHLPRADYVLIGHSHFDHAMDAPVIARRDGCPVYGSRSMATLMRAHGLAAQAVEVEFFKVYELGPFRVTFVPSVHSKLVLGLRIPYAGDITCEHTDGSMACSAYKCGQVYGIHVEVAGFSIYHQGSADLIDEAIRHRGVDLFLVGISGRAFTHEYAGRILRLLQPRWVLPHHHDNFFHGLDQPMRFSFNVNLYEFTSEVAAVSREFELVTLDLLQTTAS